MLRPLLAALACALVPALAASVTIDDFAVPFPPPGDYTTDASGTGGGVQSPIAVLGGTRDTTVTANDPANPTSAQILANPSPPPATDIVHLVTGGPTGGALDLSYPQSPAYDATFGSSAPVPSVLAVRSTLMVSGASVEVTLEDDTAGAATASLAGLAFTGEHGYQFFLGPQSFPGVDFSAIADFTVSVVEPAGADTELSDLSLLPLATKTVVWESATVFQTSGASGPEDPTLILGVPPPSGPPSWDLTDPTRPTITFPDQPPDPVQPPEPVRIQLAFDQAFAIDPSTAPDPGGFAFSIADGHVYQVVIEVEASGGRQLNPESFFGFNPQPEPPAQGFFGTPFGYGFSMEAAGGAAPQAQGEGEGDTTTLSFQILDNGTPLSLSTVDPQLYWVDTGTLTVERADFDGGSRQTVATPPNAANGVAIDPYNGFLYWIECCGTMNSRIRRAAPGGGGEVTISTGASFAFPQRIVVDPGNDYLFFSDSTEGAIHRSATNGSGLTTLLGPDNLRSPVALALDPVAQKLYWTEFTGGEVGIHRMNLDGTVQEPVLTASGGALIQSPEGLAIDAGGDRMYWTDRGRDEVRRAHLDGSGVEVLATFSSHGLQDPTGIAVDPNAQKLYWSDTTTDVITQADLDGGNPVDIVTTGSGFVRDLDLVRLPEPGRVAGLAAGLALLVALRRRPGRRAGSDRKRG